MAIYSVGRRRIIFAVLLTCVLLLVLDRDGNPLVNRVRDAAALMMRPVDTATDVAARPVVRIWRSYHDYDELLDENLALRAENERLRGTQAAAEAAVRDYAELAALSDLPSLAGIETVVAQVVGRSATNLDEIVEINKGSLSGIVVGMPVVNGAGLVGKVTSVTPTTARIRLVSDPQYNLGVEILVGSAPDDGDEPVVTSPSGLTPEQIEDLTTTTTAPTTTVPETGAVTPGDGAVPPTTLATDVISTDTTLPGTPAPGAAPDPTGTDPTDTDPTDTDPTGADPTGAGPTDPTAAGTTTTTTTTLPFAALEKEFGVITGRGRDRLPQIQFVQDNPALTVLVVGDRIVTAGGSTSLAPAGIPVGRVVNRVERPGVSGPLLEVELDADLGRLNFVQVVLYRPLTEVGG